MTNHFAGANFTEGLQDVLDECDDSCCRCRGCCTSCADMTFNIDNGQSHPMVVTCWIVFLMCVIFLAVSIPAVIANSADMDKTTVGVFYGIVGFFLLVSGIAIVLSCIVLPRYSEIEDDIL